MSKHKKIAISIFAILLYLSKITSTEAQTCTPAPNCDSLGYTMSLSDCGTLEHIKCPFDLSKVYCNKYCANGHKNGAWVVGEFYYDKDGNNLGIISSTDGTHGILISNFSKSSKYDDGVDFCEKQKVGGLAWSLMSKNDLENICNSSQHKAFLDIEFWLGLQEDDSCSGSCSVLKTVKPFCNTKSYRDKENDAFQVRCSAAF